MNRKRLIFANLFALIILFGSVVNVLAAYCPHANMDMSMTSAMDHHAHMDHGAMSSHETTPLPEVCDLGTTCAHAMSSILQPASLSEKVLRTSELFSGEPIIPHSAFEEHTPPPPRS